MLLENWTVSLLLVICSCSVNGAKSKYSKDANAKESAKYNSQSERLFRSNKATMIFEKAQKVSNEHCRV